MKPASEKRQHLRERGWQEIDTGWLKNGRGFSAIGSGESYPFTLSLDEAYDYEMHKIRPKGL